MANGEEERAARASSRGKEAAAMLKRGVSTRDVRSFIAEQGGREAEGRRINRTIGKSAGYSSDPMSYKKGGRVKRTGMARVHRGERILTRKQARRYQSRRR